MQIQVKQSYKGKNIPSLYRFPFVYSKRPNIGPAILHVLQVNVSAIGICQSFTSGRCVCLKSLLYCSAHYAQLAAGGDRPRFDFSALDGPGGHPRMFRGTTFGGGGPIFVRQDWPCLFRAVFTTPEEWAIVL